MKSTTLFSLPAIAVVAIMAGCLTPIDRKIAPRFIDPPVTSYFTGEVPDFANRQTKDPQTRKIRIANLWVECIAGHYVNIADFKKVAGAVENKMSDFAFEFLPLRKQAAGSKARLRLSDDMVAALQKVCRYRRNSVLFEKYKYSVPGKYKYTMMYPSDWEFLDGYPGEEWLHRVNAELSNRYPNLFSMEDDAFPVDAVMALVHDPVGGGRIKTVYEAWLLGVPFHAEIITEDFREGRIFKADRAFLDPHEALAASLFKLSESDWEGLEKGNPNDFSWLTSDVQGLNIGLALRDAAKEVLALAKADAEKARAELEEARNNAIRAGLPIPQPSK